MPRSASSPARRAADLERVRRGGAGSDDGDGRPLEDSDVPSRPHDGRRIAHAVQERRIARIEPRDGLDPRAGARRKRRGGGRPRRVCEAVVRVGRHAQHAEQAHEGRVRILLAQFLENRGDATPRQAKHRDGDGGLKVHRYLPPTPPPGARVSRTRQPLPVTKRKGPAPWLRRSSPARPLCPHYRLPVSPVATRSLRAPFGTYAKGRLLNSREAAATRQACGTSIAVRETARRGRVAKKDTGNRLRRCRRVAIVD